jgi:hypothetical protein
MCLIKKLKYLEINICCNWEENSEKKKREDIIRQEADKCI